MPRPLNVDWNFIQALWLQGLTPAVIAEKTGVKTSSIVSRAYRKGWPELVRKTKAELAKAPQTSVALQVAEDHAKALVKASQIAQETFSKELHAQAAILSQRPPRRLADLANNPAREGRASVVSKLVNTAAKLYGWDAQSTQPQTLKLTQINVAPPDVKPSQVIDVPYDD